MLSACTWNMLSVNTNFLCCFDLELCYMVQQGQFSIAFCFFIHSSIKYSILIFLDAVVLIYNTTNAPNNVITSSTAATTHNILLFQISNSRKMIMKPSHYHTTSPHIHTFKEKGIHLFHNGNSTK